METMNRELIIQVVAGFLFSTFVGYALGFWTIQPFVAFLAMFFGAMIGVAIARYWQKRKEEKH